MKSGMNCEPVALLQSILTQAKLTFSPKEFRTLEPRQMKLRV